MRVELTEPREGRRVSYPVGTVLDLPHKEAVRLINAGHAIPERSQPVETTTRRRGRPRKAETAG